MPWSIGEERALTVPTSREAKIAPGMEPIVPSTMTANAGSKREKADTGLNRTR